MSRFRNHSHFSLNILAKKKFWGFLSYTFSKLLKLLLEKINDSKKRNLRGIRLNCKLKTKLNDPAQIYEKAEAEQPVRTAQKWRTIQNLRYRLEQG